MPYINTTNNAYPLTERDIRAAHPNTSFPSQFRAPEGYEWVFPTPQPTPPNPVIQMARETAPAVSSKGQWEQQWEVVDKFADYTDDEGVLHTKDEQEAAALAADAAAKAEALKSSIVSATEQRLDAFARTRGYDDIKSASDYAGCSVPQFSIEGQYCKDKRAETWAKCYEILAEVQAGTRPVPSGYDDIEPDLPALVWPT